MTNDVTAPEETQLSVDWTTKLSLLNDAEEQSSFISKFGSYVIPRIESIETFEYDSKCLGIQVKYRDSTEIFG